MGLHDFKEGVQLYRSLSGLPLTITKTSNNLVSISNGSQSAVIKRADIPLEADSVGHIIDDVSSQAFIKACLGGDSLRASGDL
eukprot:1155585-Pelagomonas_calceolata.AAC.3